jgi:hypothetical protein
MRGTERSDAIAGDTAQERSAGHSARLSPYQAAKAKVLDLYRARSVGIPGGKSR